MMAEDKQDDLSMEDILSSIKDILDKDTQPQITPDEELQIAPAPAEIVVEEPEEDVYDLSKTMIIEEPLLSEISSNIAVDEDIDLNFDDMDTNLDNLDLSGLVEDVAPEVETTIEAEPAVEPEVSLNPVLEIEADSLLEITSDEPLEMVADSTKDVEFEIIENSDPADDFANDSPLFEVNDTDADPIFTEDSEGDASLDALFAQETEEESVAEIKISNPEELFAQENSTIEDIDDILSSASKVIYADTDKDANVQVTQAEEPVIVTAPIIAEPIIKEEPKVEETLSVEQDNATDVSANIINNFAKMFADKKEPAPIEAPAAAAAIPYAEINELGNGSKTITDIVEDVIKNIINTSVSAELDSKIDIASYAKAEIKTQTQVWLEANLPAVVEAAVQKEIERVMAKVGK